MKKEKVRATDYQNEDKPKTRLQQYGYIFKHRFVELLKVSLLQAVFNMPLIVSLIIFYIAVKNSPDVNALMTVFLIQGASFLISLSFTFIGMTGVFYCMKKVIYDEGEFASSSFFIGLREEWKNGLFIGLLAGFSALITIIGFYFFYFHLSQVDTIITGFGIAILVIQLIVVLMVCYYSIGQAVVYSNQLRYVLKNSFIMTLIRFPINLLFFIIYPGIFIALICIMDITMYVGVGLLVFFSTFGHLMWALNDISAFDKFINKEQHPDFYRKGLQDINITQEV